MSSKRVIKNIAPLNHENIGEVQDFISDVWKEFFPGRSKQDILSTRKDLQNPFLFFSQRNGIFWNVKEQGKIIATIGIHEVLYKGKGVGFLRRFYIDQKFRNKGLGQKILFFVEEYAKEKGWEYVMFGVDKNMERNKSFHARNRYEEFTEDIPQEILDDTDEWYLRKKM
jgi:GNAT superfamily N-acetyltransferase